MSGINLLFAKQAKQPRRLDFERVRQLHDIQETDIALSALDAPNIISMQVGKFGQLLLRQFPPCAELAYLFAKQLAGIGGGHLSMVPSRSRKFYTL